MHLCFCLLCNSTKNIGVPVAAVVGFWCQTGLLPDLCCDAHKLHLFTKAQNAQFQNARKHKVLKSKNSNKIQKKSSAQNRGRDMNHKMKQQYTLSKYLSARTQNLSPQSCSIEWKCNSMLSAPPPTLS